MGRRAWTPGLQRGDTERRGHAFRPEMIVLWRHRTIRSVLCLHRTYELVLVYPVSAPPSPPVPVTLDRPVHLPGLRHQNRHNAVHRTSRRSDRLTTPPIESPRPDGSRPSQRPPRHDAARNRRVVLIGRLVLPITSSCGLLSALDRRHRGGRHGARSLFARARRSERECDSCLGVRCGCRRVRYAARGRLDAD